MGSTIILATNSHWGVEGGGSETGWGGLQFQLGVNLCFDGAGSPIIFAAESEGGDFSLDLVLSTLQPDHCGSPGPINSSQAQSEQVTPTSTAGGPSTVRVSAALLHTHTHTHTRASPLRAQVARPLRRSVLVAVFM